MLGFDCIAPLKPFLGEGFKALSQRLEQAVFLRYGLPRWNQRDYAAHKRADHLAAASEAVHIAGWSVEEVRRTLQIRAIPLSSDPLQPIYGGAAWEPWEAALACQRFLAELRRLQGLIV